MTDGSLACRCCGRDGSTQELKDALVRLERKMDRELTVTSGFRCEAHNARVGGVKASAHCHGLAADVAVRKEEQAVFCQAARECGFRVVLPYPQRGFVHVALASSKELAHMGDERA